MAYFFTKPFEKIDLGPSGGVSICQPGCVRKPIGNALKENLRSIWNSKAAQELRKTVLDGNFKVCENCNLKENEEFCFSGDIDNAFMQDVIKNKKTIIQNPRTIKIGYDRTCNLFCNTCRDELKNKKEYTENAEKIQENLIQTGWLKKAEWLVASGQGEVFASPTINKLFQMLTPEEYPNLTIKIFTNGTLLTEQKWNSLNCKDMIKWIRVSIDAATKETYEKIRRGGNFEQLVSNLEFLDRLKKEGKIKNLELTFVVQKENYKEMTNFVELGEEIGATRMQFMQLKKWNKFEEEGEYEKMAVHLENHPEHEKFVEEINKIKNNKVFYELLEKFRD